MSAQIEGAIKAATKAGMGAARISVAIAYATEEFEEELRAARIKRGYQRLFRDCQWSGHSWQRDTHYRPAEVYNCHDCCASVFSDGAPDMHAKGFFGNRAAAGTEPGLNVGPMESYGLIAGSYAGGEA